MTDPMRLGVCYYPEHWPEERWADDARRMAAMGLSRVRIGEFAWARIEPEPGQFDWGWLDRAVETLQQAGLGIIMGTPTATPPKWLVDRMPDMVALDREGRPRHFGSRRHYCFSHDGYAAEAERIVTAVADRYGQHPAIVAWQTDNEYGCHDTAVSYSSHAVAAFRAWLEARYGDMEALNAAWGNVFWSMTYRAFDEIDLPNLTVTEANPAHWMDFRRFSSDQVVWFNRRQATVLRARSPGRPIMHNFMGFFTQFDHHDVARDLDVVGWDSYPLGFLEQFWFCDADKLEYARQGHPDIAAFHHDLYRGCTPNGRWAVLEQQPGPVNWAHYNPAPLPGMIRLWTLEAMAHGAELVSYFRWRQLPFGQEQMHAGLLRPDSSDDVGADEVRQAAAEIAALGALETTRAPIALLFDYPSCWVSDIQPQGRGASALRTAFDYYSAFRRLGFDIDILPADAPLEGYRLVVIPFLAIIPPGLIDSLRMFTGKVLIGPRCGSKTDAFAIPAELPPGPLQVLLPLRVLRVESLRPGTVETGAGFSVCDWLEHVETAAAPTLVLDSGRDVAWRHGDIDYLGAGLDEAGRLAYFADVAGRAGLDPVLLPPALRTRKAGNLRFVFNYGQTSLPMPDTLMVDGEVATISPAGVAVLDLGHE